MNRYIKYSLLIVAIGLAAYKSVYVKKLSTIKVTGNEKFDAVLFSKKLWEEKLPAKLDSAVELVTFIKTARANPGACWKIYPGWLLLFLVLFR